MKPYLKAAAGFLAGAVTAYLANADGGLTSAEWLYILLAGLGSSGLVYAVPNKPQRPTERGQVSVLYVLLIVLVVLVILFLLGAFR